MTIQDTLQDLNELFSIFDNPKDKLIQLMDMAKDSGTLSEKEKIDENKIYGCTAQAWVIATPLDKKTFKFQTDSDAMIVKGLLALLEKIFSGQPASSIQNIDSEYILDSIGLDGLITNQRTNGFSKAVEKIQGIIR